MVDEIWRLGSATPLHGIKTPGGLLKSFPALSAPDVLLHSSLLSQGHIFETFLNDKSSIATYD
jgi:hypothetical protein